jgi:hypothetical protein
LDIDGEDKEENQVAAESWKNSSARARTITYWRIRKEKLAMFSALTLVWGLDALVNSLPEPFPNMVEW